MLTTVATTMEVMESGIALAAMRLGHTNARLHVSGEICFEKVADERDE